MQFQSNIMLEDLDQHRIVLAMVVPVYRQDLSLLIADIEQRPLLDHSCEHVLANWNCITEKENSSSTSRNVAFVIVVVVRRRSSSTDSSSSSSRSSSSSSSCCCVSAAAVAVQQQEQEQDSSSSRSFDAVCTPRRSGNPTCTRSRSKQYVRWRFGPRFFRGVS